MLQEDIHSVQISLNRTTVDGSEIPNNHLECRKPRKYSNGINYQPQLVKTGFLNHQQYGKGFLVSCIHDKELVYQHGPCERPLLRLNCAVIFSKIL